MKEGTILKDRYTLLSRVGQGGTAVTWLAEDRETGGRVVVKLLSVGQIEEWKAVELFDREAGVLRGMHHEGIPAYVDCFRAGKGAHTLFALVQDHVEGRTLSEKVETGWRGTEEEIGAIGIRLLRIVAYIHSLRPPVIHRDINPRNVVVRDDATVFLVDFGGVQDAVRLSTSAGATVIGTPGYMPMEQFVGRATVRSDLYGCAATLLFLLTHCNPQDLPVKDMKIDAASAVDLSPGMARVLDSWLEPDEARRTLSIDEAIACLEGRPAEHGSSIGAPWGRPAEHGSSIGAPGGRQLPARLGKADAMLKAFEAAVARRIPEEEEAEGDGTGDDAPDADLAPPQYSRIRVVGGDDDVIMVIPSRGSRGNRSVFTGFSVIWLGFVAFWTFSTVAMGAWPMAFFSIPFWIVGIFLFGGMLKGVLGKTILHLDARKGFTLERSFLGRRSFTAPFNEVSRVRVVETGTVNHQAVTALELEVGARKFSFGQNLSTIEKKWVRRNVNALVKAMDARKG
jgi:serine/threonine protein kinase